MHFLSLFFLITGSLCSSFSHTHTRFKMIVSDSKTFYANSCLSPEDMEMLSPNCYHDVDINSGEETADRTLTSLCSERSPVDGLGTSKTYYGCKMYAFFYIKKKNRCSIFVNIFYNKRCNYLCVSVQFKKAPRPVQFPSDQRY